MKNKQRIGKMITEVMTYDNSYEIIEEPFD